MEVYLNWVGYLFPQRFEISRDFRRASQVTEKPGKFKNVVKIAYKEGSCSYFYFPLKRTYVNNFSKRPSILQQNKYFVLQILTQSQPTSFDFANSFFCSIFSAIQVNK